MSKKLTSLDLALYLFFGGTHDSLRTHHILLLFLNALLTKGKHAAQLFKQASAILAGRKDIFAAYMLCGATGPVSALAGEPGGPVPEKRPMTAAYEFVQFHRALGRPTGVDWLPYLMGRAGEAVPGCVTGTIEWAGETRPILLWEALLPPATGDYWEDLSLRTISAIRERRAEAADITAIWGISEKVCRLTWGRNRPPYCARTPRTVPRRIPSMEQQHAYLLENVTMSELTDLVRPARPAPPEPVPVPVPLWQQVPLTPEGSPEPFDRTPSPSHFTFLFM